MKSSEGGSEKGSRPPAVLVDFDDTAAEQNVAEMLLKRFGDSTWNEVRRRFRAGEINLKEYQEITFRNIQADRPAMERYVKRNANLRPYFRALWGYCSAHSIPMAIVSQGLDFYIQALLEKEGVPEMPVHCVNARFTPEGITYHYRYARPGQERQGNSKGLVVEGYRGDGHYVFYVGDGISDFEAASGADLLFAHRTLAEECDRTGIPYRPFVGFDGVLTALQEYVRNGHVPAPGPVPSSGAPGGPDGHGEALP